MRIIQIPVLSDNYVFLLLDEARHQAVVIDPAVADPVLSQLESLGSELVGIWNTHHHHDHVGGNRALLKRYPHAEVIAGAYDHKQARIPGQTRVVVEGDRLSFADRDVQILDCPGHTLGHIAYYFPPQETEPHLFCGDTLFAGGCGRLFEGDPAQMMDSLAKFMGLPPNTKVWCAHEYTLKNLKFALTLVPENSVVQARLDTVAEMRQQGEATIPTVLAKELESNPFLRCGNPTFQHTVGADNPLTAFTNIRKLRDRY